MYRKKMTACRPTTSTIPPMKLAASNVDDFEGDGTTVVTVTSGTYKTTTQNMRAAGIDYTETSERERERKRERAQAKGCWCG